MQWVHALWCVLSLWRLREFLPELSPTSLLYLMWLNRTLCRAFALAGAQATQKSFVQPAHDPSTSPVSTPTSLTVESAVDEASISAPTLQDL